MKNQFLILLIFIFISFVGAQNGTIRGCYEGYGIDKRSWDKTGCENARWCLKFADKGNDNEMRQCDEGNMCESLGNVCGKPEVNINHFNIDFPADILCCCNTDYCNHSATYSIMALPLLLFIFCIF